MGAILPIISSRRSPGTRDIWYRNYAAWVDTCQSLQRQATPFGAARQAQRYLENCRVCGMQMQEGGEEMMTKNAVQQIEEAEHRRKNTKLWLWSRQRNCSLMRSGGAGRTERRSVRRRHRGGNRIHKRNKLRSFVQTRL